MTSKIRVTKVRQNGPSASLDQLTGAFYIQITDSVTVRPGEILNVPTNVDSLDAPKGYVGLLTLQDYVPKKFSLSMPQGFKLYIPGYPVVIPVYNFGMRSVILPAHSSIAQILFVKTDQFDLEQN